ncbi:MAG: phage terminase large subunit, partial [Acidobacteria bacterium]|nr:phage terminase large subunit [Acidobacteriota bacterium]
TADYSACVTIGQLEERGPNGELPGLYLLHAWHGRVSFSELKRQAKQFARQFRPDAVVIEDAASGQSLLQELRIDTDLPLQPVKVAGDKLVRAAAAEPTISAGRVMVPEGAPWVEEFLREVCAFPAAPHDDFVDSLVHAIVHLRSDPTYNWRRWVRDQAIIAAARDYSAEAAALRFGMEVDEIEEIVRDYDDAGRELIEEYERRSRLHDPYWRCYHCGQEIVPGTSVTDNMIHRFHKDCATKRRQLGLPI